MERPVHSEDLPGGRHTGLYRNRNRNSDAHPVGTASVISQDIRLQYLSVEGKRRVPAKAFSPPPVTLARKVVTTAEIQRSAVVTTARQVHASTSRFVTHRCRPLNPFVKTS